jgi:hypothetical protein
MPRFKKKKPAGVCSVCFALTDDRDQVNHRCRRVYNNRRCSGRYHHDLGLIWDECQSCHAIGKVGSEVCIECGGFGWRLFA